MHGSKRIFSHTQRVSVTSDHLVSALVVGVNLISFVDFYQTVERIYFKCCVDVPCVNPY